ncbi:hypothetical protein [Actibacterium sp. XHP0104]|uniref:hypothetical protein n=1 Tax=Actibacterium sp. XHP0104 TaxID=2984335 RepID=UPI0021E98A30|nr:hypothetical protein [Actibacterium sp. XHP0104]MCV2882981.1 hypothetical protein [Actibacterium sp. XHP0104]
MIIHPVEISSALGRCRVSATIEIETPGRVFPKTGTRTQELWIDWPESYLKPTEARPDGFVIMCLTLAMCLGERLQVRGAMSQSLVLNLLEAMAIYKHYFLGLCEIVDLDAEGEFRPRGASARVGSFYSGGVDSLYNIAESARLHREFGTLPITDLWLIQGMDIALDQDDLWEKTKSTIFAQLPAGHDMICADIRTNVRDLHYKIVDWEKLGFSVVLGGISKVFAPIVPNVLIGSYAKYDKIVPHASSPLVDPMWSCDEQSVRHFSCRASRQDKIETVATHAPYLLQGLRVCHKNTGGAYNCGVCEKCMRTQAQLIIGGYQQLADTFDTELSSKTLRRLKLPWRWENRFTWDFWRDIQAGFRERGETDLDHALSHVFRKYTVKRAVRRCLGGR